MRAGMWLFHWQVFAGSARFRVGESEKLNLRRSFIIPRRRFNVLRRRFIIPRRRFNFASGLHPREVGARAPLPGVFVRSISWPLEQQEIHSLCPSLTDTRCRENSVGFVKFPAVK